MAATVSRSTTEELCNCQYTPGLREYRYLAHRATRWGCAVGRSAALARKGSDQLPGRIRHRDRQRGTHAASRPCAAKNRRVCSSLGKIELVALARPHIGDGRALGYVQCGHAWPAVFATLPTPPLTVRRRNSQGSHPWPTPRLELPCEPHQNYFGHGHIKGDPAMATAHQAPPRPGQHPQPAARRSMAIGSQERLAGCAKTLQMHLVAMPLPGRE
jgi:hypothetical protein